VWEGIQENEVCLNTSNSDSRNNQNKRKQKVKDIEFTEERAKKLYEELLVQYLKKNYNEIEASERSKKIIRKQCSMRGMSSWDWI
jgi:hypothetical protein